MKTELPNTELPRVQDNLDDLLDSGIEQDEATEIEERKKLDEEEARILGRRATRTLHVTPDGLVVTDEEFTRTISQDQDRLNPGKK